MKTLPVVAVITSCVLFAACIPEVATPQTTWYEDSDGDLYGDPNSTFTGDQPGAGWLTDNTDCDDTDSAINVDGTETANLKDDNCDGAVDDGFNYIFISSTTHNGDFTEGATYPDPLIRADEICQSLANASDLPAGTYKAWLMTSSIADIDQRMTQSTNPYVEIDGSLLANNWSDLVSNSSQGLRSKLNLTELNTPVAVFPATTVWANVWFLGSEREADFEFEDSDGNYTGVYYGPKSACNNWSTSDSSEYGVTGFADISNNSAWTGYYSGHDIGNPTSQWDSNCGKSNPLYCVQQ